LPITLQLSPYAAFLPAQVVEIDPSEIDSFLEYDHNDSISSSTSTQPGKHRLSKQAIQQLYGLCRSQPVLGHTLNEFLYKLRGGIFFHKQHQQLCVSLVADAVLSGERLYYNAWRHLRRLEVNIKAIPAALSDLFAYLIVVVTEGVSIPKSAINVLQDLFTVIPTSSSSNSSNKEGTFLNLQDWRTEAIGSLKNLMGKAIKNQSSSGAVSSTSNTKPLNEKNIHKLSKIYEALLSSCSGGSSEPDTEAENSNKRGGQQSCRTALKLFCGVQDEYMRLKMTTQKLPPAFNELKKQVKKSKPKQLALGDDIKSSFSKAIEDESYITAENKTISKNHLFTVSQSFWDSYFEFTRVTRVHCLEYVVTTACRFIREGEIQRAAWLLGPFPQLKPLVILLCWSAHAESSSMSKAEILQRRRILLEILWRSYIEEEGNLGDLWVDYCVEVLYYSVRISLWIASYKTSGNDYESSNRTRSEDVDLVDNNSLSLKKFRSEDEYFYSSAATILEDILGGHSILYVMRSHLPKVESKVLLSTLERKLPPLRLRTAASQHSYDLDLTRCYYAVRCAMNLVETLSTHCAKEVELTDGISNISGSSSSTTASSNNQDSRSRGRNSTYQKSTPHNQETMIQFV